MPTNPHLRGLLITVAAVLILSPDALLVKLMQTDAWTMLFWRSLISSASLLVGLTVIYRRKIFWIFRKSGRLGLTSGIITAWGSLLFIGALYHTTAANTLVILAATPLFAALIGRLSGQDRISRLTLLTACSVFGGIALLFIESFSADNLLGNLMALGASSLWGGNLVVLRQARERNMIPAVALGAILAVPLSLLFGAAPLSIGAHDLLLLSLQGTLVLPISFALITSGARDLPAAEVSLILLLETLLGPLWVWLVVGEAPGSLTLGAGIFVLCALALHSLISLRLRQSHLILD
ncbi:DMT family transporter [Geopsychrobacter electrodiphilus]|uniref:DMT family transporter n=1 Tax=Geopsychrobacter electrodiphilus TaxID=225196 RepID=UPI00036E28DE|nr:DMT family transporter [Geopsychrobacter electrodiphilus]